MLDQIKFSIVEIYAPSNHQTQIWQELCSKLYEGHYDDMIMLDFNAVIELLKKTTYDSRHTFST